MRHDTGTHGTSPATIIIAVLDVNRVLHPAKDRKMTAGLKLDLT